MRPLLSVVLVPSTPMNEDRLSTAGFSRIFAFKSCCSSTILVNEASCSASDTPWISPVSCTGKKPLGTTMKRMIVSASVATATKRVSVRRISTQSKVRA